MKKQSKKQNIFSDLDLSQIYTYIQKGDLPVKYAYVIPHGADAWEKLEKYSFKNNGASFQDSDLLCGNKSIYLQELSLKDDENIIIFDFGCGEGKTVESFIKLLSKERKIIYHAFDISKEMIKKNKKRIAKIKNVSYFSDIVDFERGDFFEKVFNAKVKHGNKNVLGLLLGNTLGNFSSEERILSNIMDVFNADDRLIVGIGRPEIQSPLYIDSLVKDYKKKIFGDVFMTTINFFDAKSKKDLIVEFDFSKNTINVYCVFKEKTSFYVGKKKVIFKKGERIRVGKSKKIDEQELSIITKNLNLRISNLRTNRDNTYLQICLSNKRYI